MFDRYVGKYEVSPTFVVTITREGPRYVGQATGQGKFEIFPESEASFFARAPELTIVFVKDAGGKVTHFMMTQGGRTTKATRIE